MFDEVRRATACFSGHRPQRFAWGYDESDTRCVSLINKLKTRIVNAIGGGCMHFICGGAIGVDIWCGELTLELREDHDITLEVVVPCAGQEKSWPYEAQERYYTLLSRADKTVVLRERYTPSCMMERNSNMISRSGLLIAVFDGTRSGGTWQTIKMAMRDRLEMDILNP